MFRKPCQQVFTQLYINVLFALTTGASAEIIEENTQQRRGYHAYHGH